MAEEGEKVE